MSWIVKKCFNNQTEQTEFFCYSSRLNSYIVTKSKSMSEYLNGNSIERLLKDLNKEMETDNVKSKLDRIESNSNIKKSIERNNRIINRFKNELTLESAHACIWAITPKCNLKCKYCYNEELIADKTIDLENKEIWNIAKNLVENGVGEVAIGGGEPLLLGRVIWEICGYLLDNHLSVSLLTNALLMTDEDIVEIKKLLNKKKGNFALTVSLDGPKSHIHEQTRGRGFNQIVSNLRKISKHNIPFYIETVVTKNNIGHIKEMCEFADQLGAYGIIFLKLGGCCTTKTFYELVPELKEEVEASRLISTLKESYLGFSVNNFELDHSCLNTNGNVMECLIAGVFSCYIDPYGEVFPCTAAIDKRFSLGNLRERSLKDIWKESSSNAFVKLLKRKTETLSGCRDCDIASNCNGGCRGEAFFLYDDLEEKPYRCKKKLM